MHKEQRPGDHQCHSKAMCPEWSVPRGSCHSRTAWVGGWAVSQTVTQHSHCVQSPQPLDRDCSGVRRTPVRAALAAGDTGTNMIQAGVVKSRGWAIDRNPPQMSHEQPTSFTSTAPKEPQLLFKGQKGLVKGRILNGGHGVLSQWRRGNSAGEIFFWR